MSLHSCNRSLFARGLSIDSRPYVISQHARWPLAIKLYFISRLSLFYCSKSTTLPHKIIRPKCAKGSTIYLRVNLFKPPYWFLLAKKRAIIKRITLALNRSFKKCYFKRAKFYVHPDWPCTPHIQGAPKTFFRNAAFVVLSSFYWETTAFDVRQCRK